MALVERSSKVDSRRPNEAVDTANNGGLGNALYERLADKFEADVMEIVKSENSSGKLKEDAQVRLTLRDIITNISKTAELQMNAIDQSSLQASFAAELMTFNEFYLAQECYQRVLSCSLSIEEVFKRTRVRVDALQGLARAIYLEISAAKTCRIAPMSVSKLLVCVEKLRESLSLIFELPSRVQEENVWQILNGCKILSQVGQPLVWLYCGKYMTESFLFAASCMESVINLCTARHLAFRLKLYISAFYSALTQGTTEEASAIVAYADRQVKELRAREELDPPIPRKVEVHILRAEVDVAVMRCALGFWRDPDSFSLQPDSIAKLGFPPIEKLPPPVATDETEDTHNLTYADRCLCECARVQQLSAGNANETWRRRSGSLLKAFWAEFGPIPVEDYAPRSRASTAGKGRTGSAGVNGGVNEAVGLLGALDLDDLSPDGNVAVAAGVPGEVPPPPISLDSLLEMTIIAAFDAVENAHVDDILKKISSIVALYDVRNHDDSRFLRKLRLITQLVTLIETAPGAQRIAAGRTFIAELDNLLHTDVSERKKTLFQRVAFLCWSRFIYPSLQSALSAEKSSGSTKTQLRDISPVLVAAVRALDIAEIEDPVLMGGISLTAASLLSYLGDHRGSIAIFRQAIDTMEDHRAARMDVLMHMPEDARDVYALQRGSFTTRGEAQDWFHSKKRLGAHAYAGFGIFGLDSMSDKLDQALAEIHTDLVVSYFRAEICYEISQRVLKETYKAKMGPRAGTAVGIPNPALASSSPTARASATTTAPAVSVSANLLPNVKKLPVVVSLRSYIGKNAYSRCLLYLELARVEADDIARLELLQEARSSIEECEAREKMLTESFDDLIVMKAKERRFPLVLARSHRCVYVCPVGARKLKRKQTEGEVVEEVAYYRVLAKEQGSGTDASLASISFAGCERRVYVQNMQSPSDSVVRIEPLRSGERYVFASAAFSATDKPIGSVSPTSPTVDAVNPLPTILLWTFLARAAVDLGELALAKRASTIVCNRFFIDSFKYDPVSVGKGINLFIMEEEPALCMMAVHQSSPVVLQNFVHSFLILETKSGRRDLTELEVPKERQSKLLTSLRRTVSAAVISCYVNNQELILKCVALGYSLASELLVFDEISLAGPLQSSLLALITSLQTIPKQNWHDLEHKLYCHLLQHAVKLSLITRNVAPTATMMSALFPEVGTDKTSVVVLSTLLQKKYASLASVIRSAGTLLTAADSTSTTAAAVGGATQSDATAAAVSAGSLDTQICKLLQLPASTSGLKGSDFWALTADQRAELVQGIIFPVVGITPPSRPSSAQPGSAASRPKEFRRPAVEELNKWMGEAPDSVSNQLKLLAQFAREIIAEQSTTKATNTNPVAKLLLKYPVFDKYLARVVYEAGEHWNLGFIYPLTQLASIREATPAAPATVAAAKSPKGKSKAAGGKDPAPEPFPAAAVAEPELPKQLVPDRFLSPSQQERELQLAGLAELAFLVALSGYSRNIVKAYYPHTSDGPLSLLSPEDLSAKRGGGIYNEEDGGNGGGGGGYEVSVDGNVSEDLTQLCSYLDNEELTRSVRINTRASVDFAASTDFGITGSEVARGSRPASALKTSSSSRPASAKPGRPLSGTRSANVEVEIDRSEFVRYLCASMSMFAQANYPAACVAVAARFWLFITDEWAAPASFALEFVAIRKSLCGAVEALLRAFEIIANVPAGQPALGFFNGSSSEEQKGGDVAESFHLAKGERGFDEEGGAAGDFHFSPLGGTTVTHLRTAKEYLIACKGLATFLLKILWLYREYADVVELGSRIMAIYMRQAPELCKDIGDGTMALMIHSQEGIVNKAEDELANRQDRLTLYIENYEETQRKQKKKKLRIARLEKTDEELQFEAGKNFLQGKVDGAAASLSGCRIRLDSLRDLQRRFETTFSTGVQLFTKVKAATREFLSKCESHMNGDEVPDGIDRADYRHCLESKFMRDELRLVLSQYQQLGHYLREKKERQTVLEALNAQGDILTMFGRFEEAKSVWQDSLDGLFSTMDACINWRSVSASALRGEGKDAPQVQSSALIAIAVLGKLSRCCVPNDWDSKLTYCRFAAELCRLPFMWSLSHPQTTIGFAAYHCISLTGSAIVTAGLDSFPSTSFVAGLLEVISVLIDQNQRLAALPAVVLLEYFLGACSRNAPKWLDVRLLRVRILIESKLFAEAASMLAGIKPAIRSIFANTYTDPVKTANTLSLNDFDTSSNGLDFYGQSPFYNHLPPTHESNKKAITWINAFPKVFRQFTTEFKVSRPLSTFSEQEKALHKKAREAAAAEEAAAVAAAAAAEAEAAKKAKKGKKDAVAVAGGDEQQPSRPKTPSTSAPAIIEPMFPVLQEVAVDVVCSSFLTELFESCGRTTGSQASDLQSLTVQASDLSTKALDVLAKESGLGVKGETLSLGNSLWISLYGQSQLLLTRSLVIRRKFRDARARLLSLVQLLHGLSVGEVGPDARRELTQLWFSTQQILCVIAQRQARFTDALTLASTGAKDSCEIMCGFWVRSFLLQRAKVHFKLGNLTEAEVDCEALENQYSASDCADLNLVRGLVLRASAIREKALNETASTAIEAMKRSLELLRRARGYALQLAKDIGFRGADCNATYWRADTAVSEDHLLSPVLHNLTITHGNRPELTIRAKVDAKKLMEVQSAGGIVAGTTTSESSSKSKSGEKERQEKGKTGAGNGGETGRTKKGAAASGKSASVPAATATTPVKTKAVNFKDAPSDSVSPERAVAGTAAGWTTNKKQNGNHLGVIGAGAPGPANQGLRRGPVDFKETVYSESEYSNIYLAEAKYLAATVAALCLLLDDARCSVVSIESQKPSTARGRTAGTSSKRGGGRGGAAVDDNEEEENGMTEVKLLREQVVISEEALQVLRHVVYASPYTRTTVLLCTGKSRVAELLTSTTYVDDNGDHFLGPLHAALTIIVAGGSDGGSSAYPCWEIARSSCVQLVECYGNHSLQWGEEATQRLRLAVMYLLFGIKIGNQRFQVTKNPLGLTSDKSLQALVAGETTTTLVAMTASSGSSDVIKRTGAAAVAATPAAAAAPVNTKGAAAGSLPPLEAPQLTGRDALFLLSATLREVDPLWTEDFERDLCIDLHTMLKSSFPVYSNKCCVSALPDASKPIPVSVGSVSSLWVPAPTPPDFFVGSGNEAPPLGDTAGLFSHVAGYFLLGAKQGSSQGAAGGAPLTSRSQAAAAAKKDAAAKAGKKPLQEEIVEETADPVLTKLVMYRADVVRIEKELRDLRDEHTDATVKNNTAGIQVCAEKFADILCNTVKLLTRGCIDDGEGAANEDDASNTSNMVDNTIYNPKTEVVGGISSDGTTSSPLGVLVKVTGEEGAPECKLSLADSVLLTLADVLSCDRDMDNAVELSVCIFMRTVLGYAD